jgi:large subunit ribosomal protein L31
MKEKIHPDYHKITVVMTDGSTFETKSTWGKEGAIHAPRHRPQDPSGRGPACASSIDRGGRVQRFKDRFGAGAGVKSTGKAAARPETPAKVAAQKK